MYKFSASIHKCLSIILWRKLHFWHNVMCTFLYFWNDVRPLPHSKQIQEDNKIGDKND
jgi:hypothetical protein